MNIEDIVEKEKYDSNNSRKHNNGQSTERSYRIHGRISSPMNIREAKIFLSHEIRKNLIEQ
jgi:hypothetical protein